jgi:predicted nucleotidyltransferase component of viral defense system
MNPAIASMLQKYNCESRQDYENALKEIIQEIALLGLWRAKFFEHAAFYGGTALRILYGLNRFSEGIDFSLIKPRNDFQLSQYLDAIATELNGLEFNVEVSQKKADAINSAFIKADTKEHLLKIDVPEEIAERVNRREQLKIKLEIDTDPPGGFETEAKTLLQPIPFSVRTYKPPDLFAGKLHAILQRAWQSGRIKGRDYYDFVWYIAQGTPVRLSHLQERLRQTGGWPEDKQLSQTDLVILLKEKFKSVDFKSAKDDVVRFIKDPASLDLWSPQFFVSLLPKLKTI